MQEVTYLGWIRVNLRRVVLGSQLLTAALACIAIQPPPVETCCPGLSPGVAFDSDGTWARLTAVLTEVLADHGCRMGCLSRCPG